MDENWHISCPCFGWCVMYRYCELQPSIYDIYADTPLSIHQWMHGLYLYTIVQATKQWDHIHTGHTIPKGYTMGRWMKTGALSSSALDDVWCTMRFNYTYRYWHHSQFINTFMDEVDTPLYQQPSNRVASILPTQHSKDGSTWTDENWHTSCSCLGWCVMDHEFQSSIHILTTLSIHWWVHGWDWYTIAQAIKQGDHIHTDHTILQGWTSMDVRKLAHFLLLPWMVYDLPWSPIINAVIGTHLISSMCVWVRLFYHYTCNQSRESHPYWPHNTQRM